MEWVFVLTKIYLKTTWPTPPLYQLNSNGSKLSLSEHFLKVSHKDTSYLELQLKTEHVSVRKYLKAPYLIRVTPSLKT